MERLPNNEQTNLNTEWDILSEKHEQTKNIKFENLSENDNLGQAAELLYSVDPYIFPDFFGTFEQAKKVGPILFSKDPNALFSFEKTVVAKDGDKIAAIICFRDHNCTPWDTELTTKKFIDAGVEIPENFERANNNYMKKITDEELPEDGVEFVFGATDPEYRRRGLIMELQNKIIRDGNYKKLYVDVLENNEKSINLNLKQGFKIVSKFDSYPDGKLQVLHMEQEIKS